jgi:hypothetical protein
MAREHLAAELDGIPRKNLSMRGEGLRKKLADPQIRHALGRAIERALQLADMTKSQASQEMGYGENQAPISRWISGVENPQFDKLFTIERLREPLVIAIAEMAGTIEVRTTLTIRRTA